MCQATYMKVQAILPAAGDRIRICPVILLSARSPPVHDRTDVSEGVPFLCSPARNLMFGHALMHVAPFFSINACKTRTPGTHGS